MRCFQFGAIRKAGALNTVFFLCVCHSFHLWVDAYKCDESVDSGLWAKSVSGLVRKRQRTSSQNRHRLKGLVAKGETNQEAGIKVHIRLHIKEGETSTFCSAQAVHSTLSNNLYGKRNLKRNGYRYTYS